MWRSAAAPDQAPAAAPVAVEPEPSGGFAPWLRRSLNESLEDIRELSSKLGDAILRPSRQKASIDPDKPNPPEWDTLPRSPPNQAAPHGAGALQCCLPRTAAKRRGPS
tara:strand:+ start:115 stop:438 length:324 start_codon:yes stop_codon:yes gene_type:complete